MFPDACPQYTVESTAWQLGPNVRSRELPGPFAMARRAGAVPSSTGSALPQTVCAQPGGPEPTERLKPRVQLPCAEPIWSVNGMEVPHATPGAAQTPKCGAIE